MVLPLDSWELMHLDHSIPDIDCVYCYPEPDPFVADPKGRRQHGQTEEVRHRTRAEDSSE